MENRSIFLYRLAQVMTMREDEDRSIRRGLEVPGSIP